MPRTYSSAHIVKVLLWNGFHLVSQRGSHAKFRKDGSPVHIVIVPLGRKDMKLGTMRSVLEQAGLTEDDLKERRRAA